MTKEQLIRVLKNALQDASKRDREPATSPTSFHKTQCACCKQFTSHRDFCPYSKVYLKDDGGFTFQAVDIQISPIP